MISAIASSTTERVLENGALNTVTPRSDAAARSIWLVPMQNAPIATSFGAASSTRSVTWVLDRMPSSVHPCRCRSISSSSSRARSAGLDVEAGRSAAGVLGSGWICSSSSARGCLGHGSLQHWVGRFTESKCRSTAAPSRGDERG